MRGEAVLDWLLVACWWCLQESQLPPPHVPEQAGTDMHSTPGPELAKNNTKQLDMMTCCHLIEAEAGEEPNKANGHCSEVDVQESGSRFQQPCGSRGAPLNGQAASVWEQLYV